MRSSRYEPTCLGCAFCTGSDLLSGKIARKRCSEFRRMKSALSAEPYLEVELQPTESVGFSAAGVLLFRRNGGGDVDLVSSIQTLLRPPSTSTSLPQSHPPYQ